MAVARESKDLELLGIPLISIACSGEGIFYLEWMFGLARCIDPVDLCDVFLWLSLGNE